MDPNRCIVCPHQRSDHEERHDQSWCRPCNADDMSGPCSYYFMGQHEYRPPLPPPDQPCSICRLSHANQNAHGSTK